MNGATAKPLTDAEANVVGMAARSLERTQDLETALTMGMLSLRNFEPAKIDSIVQVVETQAAILAALHGPEWFELAEWQTLCDVWHYAEPCNCARLRDLADLYDAA